jgi:hypothetical protein
VYATALPACMAHSCRLTHCTHTQLLLDYLAVLEREPQAVATLYHNAIDPRAFVDAREEGPSLSLRHSPIEGQWGHRGRHPHCALPNCVRLVRQRATPARLCPCPS